MFFLSSDSSSVVLTAGFLWLDIILAASRPYRFLKNSVKLRRIIFVYLTGDQVDLRPLVFRETGIQSASVGLLFGPVGRPSWSQNRWLSPYFCKYCSGVVPTASLRQLIVYRLVFFHPFCSTSINSLHSVAAKWLKLKLRKFRCTELQVYLSVVDAGTS